MKTDRHNPDISQAVDQIIGDVGYYSPLELLLRQGRLPYADYENWRSGRLEFIDSALMGSARRINSALESARDYLLALDFSAEAAEFHGWQGARVNQLLSFCADDSEIDASLLSTQYRRKQDAPQLDLFFDNQGVQLSNELIQALRMREAALAEQRLQQLEAVDPNHPLCGQAANLLQALHRLQQGSDPRESAQRLDELENQLLPLASEALQGQTRDFMAAFWRDLAHRLEGEPYDEQQPRQHAGYCYSQIPLWPQVIDSIHNTSDWQQHPGLYRLLALALQQSQRRIDSIQLICDFCWQFPQLGPDFITDAHSARQYADFVDQGLDSDWGWAQFPCWLLLHESGLANHTTANQSLAGDAGGYPQQGPLAFSLLQQLLLSDSAELDLRARLKSAQPQIFDAFMRRFSAQ